MDMIKGSDLEINPALYELSVRIINALRQRLGVNIKLHGPDEPIHDGQIFLFNHFARFETFIPQYLIYQRTGDFSRSIATAEIFRGNESFADYLRGVGAVPNDYPRLLPFLAEETLRGRKVIIFPEGGMVKDRRVVDQRGHYSIYSRTAHERRKHHAGAAVLALTLDAFKAGVLALREHGEEEHLARWADTLKLAGVEALMEAARKPTLIVPSNITFYPIRVSDNILRRGAELFAGGISRRFNEELLIEGNLLLKHTDMDLRLGAPIRAKRAWHWYERWLLMRLLKEATTMDELFAMRETATKWEERMTAKYISRRSMKIRDRYMRDMYLGATINISHLASRTIIELMDRGRTEIERVAFRKMVYLAIHKVRERPTIHLHRSLLNPRAYMCLPEASCEALRQLARSAERAMLMKCDDKFFRFLPKLLLEHDFDEVRLENPVLVYANEAAPIRPVVQAVRDAIKEASGLSEETWARMMFEDERVLYEWERAAFADNPDYAVINDQETATESGAPYFRVPLDNNRIGVVAAHGFLASPAEMWGFAEGLANLGHPVICPRLAGHGTSPWDLKTRRWEDWLNSVRRAYHILAPFCDRIVIVGFSTGGALGLMLAAEHPEKLAGVAALCAPLKFRNRNMAFVPLVHGANRFLGWAPGIGEVMPFRPNNSEHPHINYHYMPIAGLYELKQMADALEDHLKDVTCPTLIMQGLNDKVVDAASADIIFEALGTEDKTLHKIPTDRHGILYEDVAGTHEVLRGFIASQSPEKGNLPHRNL